MPTKTIKKKSPAKKPAKKPLKPAVKKIVKKAIPKAKPAKVAKPKPAKKVATPKVAKVKVPKAKKSPAPKAPAPDRTGIKFGDRHELRERITAALEAAGDSGLHVKTLAEKTGRTLNGIYVFFSTTAKDMPEIIKVSAATYALRPEKKN